MTANHRLADAALAYASRGLPLFPLTPRGKVPLISKAQGGRGCLDATADRDQVLDWWRREPNANIGLATGAATWALDVDGEEGVATLAELEDKHGWLPEGPASITGNGGMHLLFAANDRVRNSVKRLGAGLDTRSTGGYIVAPPSIHPDTGNRYTWLPERDPWAVQLPPAPPWLLDLLNPPRPADTPPEIRQPPDSSAYVAKALEFELEAIARAGEGQRNQTLNRAAFSLGRFVAAGELDAVYVGEALLGAALATGLDEKEATATVRSGLRAGIRRAA